MHPPLWVCLYVLSVNSYLLLWVLIPSLPSTMHKNEVLTCSEILETWFLILFTLAVAEACVPTTPNAHLHPVLHKKYWHLSDHKNNIAHLLERTHLHLSSLLACNGLRNEKCYISPAHAICNHCSAYFSLFLLLFLLIPFYSSSFSDSAYELASSPTYLPSGRERAPPLNLKSQNMQPGIWALDSGRIPTCAFEDSQHTLLESCCFPFWSHVCFCCRSPSLDPVYLFYIGNWMPSSMMQQCWTTWQAEMKAVSSWPLEVGRSLLQPGMALPSRKILDGSAKWTLRSCSSLEMVS